MAILANLKKSLFPSRNYIGKNIEPYRKSVDRIHTHLESLIDKSQEELVQELNACKALLDPAGISESLLKIYAIVNEAVKRTMQIVPFDVQLIGALALHEGYLIEMPTGEGKTLTAVFPAIANSSPDIPVQVITFNDYLAKRDAMWMSPVFNYLGMSVGYIQQHMSPTERVKEYKSDVTYLTAKELGFDYLRTFICYEKEDIIFPEFHYAIVDEADAILIDEARNPLVLAGDMLRSDVKFYRVAECVSRLDEHSDVHIEEENGIVYLSDTGLEITEAFLQAGNLQEKNNFDLASAVNLALEARFFLQKDVDYIVKNGKVKQVDEFTGRIIEDRKWNHGLQTAVEAKERLQIHPESGILNSITLQHLFDLYPKLAGMSATVRPAEEEFFELYGLKTVIIPPNKPSRRIDKQDLVFTTHINKEKAIIEKVITLHQSGRPVLIGTLSIKESESLSKQFTDAGLPVSVLNAKNDEHEAHIIAEAGDLSAITISTNMAGRGTDIKLGGADEMNKQAVISLGGLFVIGTNRHESRRIDKQLRGRAGRQGEPGESQFFISLEDPLMVKFRFDDIIPQKLLKIKGKDPISDKRMHKSIDKFQYMIECRLADVRKSLCLFSDLIEKQRKIIQGQRMKYLLDLPDYQVSDKRIQRKIHHYILYNYDLLWSGHLDLMTQIKEGIYTVRLGGLKPLREFQRQADFEFEILQRRLNEMKAKVREITEKKDWSELDTFEIKYPEATWTYIATDSPYTNQLALMLMDNSNIGFTADPVSAFLLFFKALFDKRASKE